MDGNGSYTAANGQWDANTTIWTVSYVAYTGIASPTFRFPSNTPDTTPPFADYDTAFNFTVDWKDQNGNEPAPTFSTYGLSLAAPGHGSVSVVSGASRLDQVGSMVIAHPTVCGYSVTSPDACKLTTNMTLTSRLLLGRYSAPTTQAANLPPLGDTIIASVSSPDGAIGTIAMEGGVDVPTAALPVVSTLSPAGGPTGTLFTISGSKLNGVGSTAFFRDSSGMTYPLALQSSSSSQLSVIVPASATSGDASVWVTNSSGTSASLRFVVGVAPTITSFTPNTGIPGQARVTMYGSGFDVTGLQIYIGTTRIEPAVAPATSPVFYRAADQIRFLVPVGVHNGPITVITDAGSVISATSFTVPGPTITTDFSAMGAVNVGDTVTVTGTNFNVGGLLVDVGGLLVDPGQVSNVTNTSFDFVVPTGATTGRVTVSTNGDHVTSDTDLIIN